MIIFAELISGLTVGLEHITGDEDEEFKWGIVLHLGFVRLLFLSLK